MMLPAIAAATALVIPMEGSSSDELCTRLHTFEHTAAKARRSEWIEIVWNYEPSGWPSFVCKTRASGPGKTLCSWLPMHSSREFPGLLAKRIIVCHGLSPDGFVPGTLPDEVISFRSEYGGQLLMKTEGAGADRLPRLRLEYFGEER
jgi:hypothetical protein